MQIVTRSRPRPAAYLLPLMWVALIALAAAWGSEVVARDPRIRLGAPPLFGRIDPRISLWILPSVLVAATSLRMPALVDRIGWRALLRLTFVMALVWPLALALSAGPGGITEGLESRHDYLHAVPGLGPIPELWGSFVDRIADLPVHVQGHPPGFVTLLAAMDGVGLGGSGWATALVLTGATLAPIAVLLVIRDVADEGAARRAAPFLVLSPAAVWIATSADAFFAGVGACAVALAVMASARGSVDRHLFAVAAGLLGAAALLLSYGLILLAAVALPILAMRRAWDVLALSFVTGIASLIAVAVVWDFDLLEGLAATRERYLVGVSTHRPFTYFLVANLAAFAIVLGPAVASSANDIPRRLLPIAAGAVIAIVLADLSGMSKGEVERIWLPFAPWLLWIAASGDRWDARTRLGLQLATALALELIVVTPW